MLPGNSIQNKVNTVRFHPHWMMGFFCAQMKHIGISIAALLFYITGSAQQDVLPFRSLTTDMGLSNGDIFCFWQDHEGYIWIGTTDGLNRYDGIGFTVYKYDQKDTTSLSSSYVSYVYEDKRNNLWIGLLNGLCKYDRDHNSFERIDYPDDNGKRFNNHVLEIYEDNTNKLWIGTDYGVYILDRDNKKFHTCFDNRCNKEEFAICNDIIQDKKGNVWIALSGDLNGGLIKYNPQTGEFTKYTSQRPEFKIKDNNILCLMVDNQDNIWISYSSKGIDVINDQAKVLYHYENNPANPYSLNNNIVFSMTQTRNNKIFIGTDGGGINVFEPKSQLFYHITTSEADFSLLSNTVQKIFMDRDGIVWAGCWGGGVNVYDERFNKFALYKQGKQANNALSGSSVTSFTQDSQGKIWIATDGGGINLFNNKKGSFIRYQSDSKNKQSLTNNKVLSIHADDRSGLWAGLWQGGLNYFKIDGNNLILKKKYNYLDGKDLNSNCVFKIYTSKSGELWIGNYFTGIYKFDPEKETFINVKLPSGVSSYNTIRDILCDSHNDMWFATEYNGLFRMNRETGEFENFIHNESDSNSLVSNSINVIYEDSKNRLWFGIDDGGLNLFNRKTKSFIQYTKEHGLPDNTIVGILEDNKGDLWISSHVGLSVANIISTDERPRIKFRNYTVQDGLQGQVFNRWAYFKSKTGEMYFGGLNGFNVFHPDSLKDNNIIPPVHFTDFLLFNKSAEIGGKNSPLEKHISQTKKLVLKHYQSVFTFRFIALNYILSEKNQYAYFMQGFDRDWNYVGNKREATYTNLNPGEYTFMVKASNSDGVWNEKGVSVKLVILPPWWKTWVFRILLIAFAILSLIGIYLDRTKRLRRNQIILEKTVHERTKELKNINIALEEKQEEINMQKEELEMQKNSVQESNDILLEQQKRIIEQNTELDKHRNKLETLISERTRELEEAKKKAEESDRLKSAFLANMSHEIRTPMNAIVGFSSLLNDRDISNEERSEFVKLIHTNSDSLLMLINDILDLSMIEANQMKVRKVPCSLNELFDQVFSFYSLNNANSSVQVTINNTLVKEDIRLNTDKYRLKQILSNFMSNACKFTKSGTIELGIRKENDSLNMYVKDTGIGIARENIKYVFERFRKLGEEASSPSPGAGLGLAISRRLSDLLGGTIEVNSEVGKGSIFSFILPCSMIIKRKEIHTAPFRPIVSKDWSDKSILIVEDEEANYLYLRRLLEKTHAAVTWAENGEEAIKQYEIHNRFDIILMDIKMPGMNGIDALKRLKDTNPHQRIIAQTAYARVEDEINLRKEGFDDYIPKPISPVDLMILLEKYL
jgi:signal transduction histidine kinase/ligand-binding sensor domain-containing protein